MLEAQNALTEGEAAERLGLSRATLRAWRMQRKGPRFVRLGRAIRYLGADLDEFLQANVVEPSGGNQSNGASR